MNSKKEITELKIVNENLEQKVSKLQLDINTIQNETVKKDTPTNNNTCEEMLLELQERQLRQKNIIILGVSEPNNSITMERREHDKMAALNILKTINPNCPEPRKFIRIGRYNKERSRPLKVIFSTKEEAISILKDKSKQPENIKIICDETPMQKQYMYKIRETFQQRQENGEENLRIKYVKGVPTIIIENQKN